MASLNDMRQAYVPHALTGQSEDQMRWFRDGKFGMFIHWGLYALLGRGEWVMFNERINVRDYAALARDFVADRFDAAAWARTAREAGMTYMVLTTKHHDGFCLFDSQVDDFTSMHSAARRDFVAEYVAACRAEGLKVGFYYSPMDWRFPGYFFPEMYLDSALEMKRHCWEHLRELMTNYGPIDLLWFDGEWLAHGGISFGSKGWYRKDDWLQAEYMQCNYFWESERLLAMIRELQPNILINNRSGCLGDFMTRERSIGEMDTCTPWESCDCLASSWGWVPNRPMLSLANLVAHLVGIAVKDGNYLLNIGPTERGDMAPDQVERLRQLGQWLERHGSTIYGTRGGPFLPGRWGGATYRGHDVHLHILDWADDRIVLPPIANELVDWSSPTSPEIQVSASERGIEVQVPLHARHPFDTIITLRFRDPIAFGTVTARDEQGYGLGDGLAKE